MGFSNSSWRFILVVTASFFSTAVQATTVPEVLIIPPNEVTSACTFQRNEMIYCINSPQDVCTDAGGTFNQGKNCKDDFNIDTTDKTWDQTLPPDLLGNCLEKINAAVGVHNTAAKLAVLANLYTPPFPLKTRCYDPATINPAFAFFRGCSCGVEVTYGVPVGETEGNYSERIDFRCQREVGIFKCSDLDRNSALPLLDVSLPRHSL